MSLSLMGFAPSLGAQTQVSVDSLTNELMCQCGCGYTVTSCAGAMQCDVADGMRQNIASMIEQGQSRNQIVAYYVAQYGEKVLAAPTKQGFNLTAWITPFAAIAAGAGLIAVVVLAWVRRTRETQTALGESQEQLSPYAEQVERDLKLYP